MGSWERMLVSWHWWVRVALQHRSLKGWTWKRALPWRLPGAFTNPSIKPMRSSWQRSLGEDPQFTEKEDAHRYPYQGYMGKSWKPAGGRPSGIIAVYRHTKNRWSSNDFKKFRFLADQTILGLQYVYVLKELEKEARTDGLTGLANYRYFSERIEEEFTRTKRRSNPLSLIPHGYRPLQRDQRHPWTCRRRSHFTMSRLGTETDNPPHGSCRTMWRG